jgi:mRNA deadenylase 3'-5' endonuclease subunit Ccr4
VTCERTPNTKRKKKKKKPKKQKNRKQIRPDPSSSKTQDEMQSLRSFGETAVLGRQPSAGTERSLSVMSYNVLAHAFCDGSELYETVDARAMDPACRRALVLERIRGARCDIVCLQEVDMGDFDTEWAPAMRGMGYAAELQNDRNRAANHIVANATFWRSAAGDGDGFVLRRRWSESRSRSLLSMFAIVDLPADTAADAAEADETGETGEGALPSPSLAPPPSPGSFAGGSSAGGGAERALVFVGNCHLQGAPQLPHLRLQQLRSVLKRYAGQADAATRGAPGDKAKRKDQRLKKRERLLQAEGGPSRGADASGAGASGADASGANHSATGQAQQQQQQQQQPESESQSSRPAAPVLIVCGDFNSPSDGAIYRYLADGALEANFLENGVAATKTALDHSLGLGSAYADLLGTEPVLTFSRPPLRAAALDFVFYPRSRLTPVAALDPLEGELEADLVTNGLPTARNGSDHLPVAVRFEWRNLPWGSSVND